MVGYHESSMDTLRKFIEKCNIEARTLFNEPMSRHTTLKIGGPADAYVRPHSFDELLLLLSEACTASIPLAILGGGANLLVADSGIRGLVVSTESLRAFRIEENGLAYVEAGLGVVELGLIARDHGLSGLEFAAGLPGSAGGAVYMNARCYDREFADILTRIDFLEVLEDGSGSQQKRWVKRSTTPDPMEWSYKHSPFMPGNRLAGAIIIGAAFQLIPDDPALIGNRMAVHEADRAAKGHFDYPSAGSLFKNNRAFGRPTGSILDELGFKGRRIGDAMVHPRHANIFVNAGEATASDMMSLIELAGTAARSAFGFELEPEVVFLGDFTTR